MSQQQYQPQYPTQNYNQNFSQGGITYHQPAPPNGYAGNFSTAQQQYIPTPAVSHDGQIQSQQQYIPTSAVSHDGRAQNPPQSFNDPNEFVPSQGHLDQESSSTEPSSTASWTRRMLSREYDSLEFKYNDLISRNKNLTGQMESLGQDSNRDRAKIQDLNQQVQYFKDLLEKEQTRCRECEYQISHLQNEGGLVAVTAKFMLVEHQLKEKHNECEIAIRDLGKLRIETKAWEGIVRESESEVKDAKRKLNELENCEKQNLEMRNRVKELEDQNSSLMETCETLTSNHNREKERREGAESQLERARSENEELLQINAGEIRASEEALAEQDALREDLSMKTRFCEDIEKKLTDAESENLRLSQTVSELEDRTQKLNVVADYAQHLRVGFFHTGHGGYINRAVILARNKAAHYGNVYVDILLFELGFMDELEKVYCEDKYSVAPYFSLDVYIGNNDMLQALADSAWADVLNMHAYLDSELKFEMKKKLKERMNEPIERFKVLEAECLERYQLLCAETSEEEALKNFGDESVSLRMQEMEGIVQQFRDIKRDRDARPR